MNCINRRDLVIGLGALGLLLTDAPARAAEEEEKAAADKFVHIHDINISDPPVGIDGPFPALLRNANVGELVIMHITYPIAPPFPKSATAVAVPNKLDVIGVFDTGGPLAILAPTPQSIPIGVGYLKVVARATQKGQSTITAKVKREDGTTKSILFTFEIQ